MIDLSQNNQVRFNIEVVSGGTEIVLHGKHIKDRKTEDKLILRIASKDLHRLKNAIDAEVMREVNSD